MKIRKISGIRKTAVRVIGWLVMLCLLGSLSAAEGVSKEIFYQEGIAALDNLSAESIRAALESFDAAGNYEYTQLYKQYALSLIDILSPDGREAGLKSTANRLWILSQDEGFENSLAANGLPSCEELVQYVQAREHEENGEYIAALNIYKTIFNVLDSLDRRISISDAAYQHAEELYRNGEYRAAAEIYQNLDTFDSAEKYQEVLAHHEHQWKEATCTEPKTCLVFGETEGEPLGHDWQEATCTEPRTCKRCGIMVDEPLGHDWQAVSCTAPCVCARCGITDSVAAGHDWREATCTEPRRCARCGATEGEPLGHDWREATYTAPQTCARCGETTGSPITIQAGNIIVFGHYEQDNDRDNGPEAIEWVVLEYDETNHKVLLLSRYGLDTNPYNRKPAHVSWETCTLRSWLNNDFLNAAFSAEEQAAILTTEVDNSLSQGYKKWGTDGGNNTQDRIFLLSCAEAGQYLGAKYWEEDKDRNVRARIAPTEYAIANGAYTNPDRKTADGRPAGWWWLRSPGSRTSTAAFVRSGGSFSRNDVERDPGMICPAFWLSLDSDIF